MIIKRKTFLSILMIFLLIPVFAARTGFSTFSNIVSIDLPEGFFVTESSSDNSTFALESSVAPVSAIIKIYEENSFKNANLAMRDVMKKLNLEFEISDFQWQNTLVSITSFEGTIHNVQAFGYGASVQVPENNKFIILLTWCQKGLESQVFPYMSSFLDGLYINIASYFDSGLFTSFTYPEEEQMDISVEIDNKKINSKMAKNAKEAAEFLVEKEYQVLLMYQNSPLWKEAWQRYYRMIFRDSCKHLMNLSFDIYNELYSDCKNDTEYAQKLLYWTQNFTYEREKTKSDFSSLPAMILGNGSDCDSRAMMLSVLLQTVNIDCSLLISNEFSHSIAILNSDLPGFSFSYNDKKYLTGETTSKGLTWGKISSDQIDQSKWIEVLLP